MSAPPVTATRTNQSDANNSVGPVLRSGELARTVIEAIELDNPGVAIDVLDKRAYLRVQADGELIVRRATIGELLGRPFQMQELEQILSSFAGQIDTTTEHMRFYFERAV